ncbi:cAMP-binding domain of CRP or a regulatory subunit of cAMP-dependent protein kinases [Pseudovibrio denitrificans]|uniref:cAMP-binding domain of CRP or a regulatory subunit of cAMP-dependent protein kinases n=2 Tax=Pseudovibrio TaxID=258255 RepID=A0A1I7BAR7_9HYPH|nr:cyclic nucleotide-binding domain-containing protein [Pseudovibrio denitrificans]EEA95477.1 cyclic nucleotide-binding domain protein [Pseudovibrio sp. JE062]SFT84277.1 cAMP-binding domain of CRP or a regulatory subunit of cAMP-dependent protein kinases [Pseudovibrio denitrificans]
MRFLSQRDVEQSSKKAKSPLEVSYGNIPRHRTQLHQRLLDLGLPTQPVIREVLDCAQYFSLKAHENLLVQGQSADRFFIILEGELEVIKVDQDGADTVLGHLKAGDVAGELAYIRAHVGPQRYIATVRAKRDTVVASLSWNRYGTLPTSTETNSMLFRYFARQAAHQLEQTSSRVLEEIKIRSRRLQAYAVLLVANMIAMSSFALFISLYKSTFDDYGYGFIAMTIYSLSLNFILAAILFYIMKNLYLPPRIFGLEFTHLPSQFGYGLVMTIPIILVMAGVRYIVHPSEESFSFYFLSHQVQGPFMGWPEFAFAIFYALVMCPIQQFIVRCGMQVPVTAALGPHKISSVFWGNFAASVAFSIIHLPYSKLAVLLTFMVSFYWGLMFQRRRSWIAVSTSHAIAGLAAFYWFALLRIA